MYEEVDSKLIVVRGNSMLPALSEGDGVIIMKKEFYEVGDIIVFEYPQERIKRLLIHRIIDINGPVYICKGDNSMRIEYVIPRKIYGKVVKIFEGYGKK